MIPSVFRIPLAALAATVAFAFMMVPPASSQNEGANDAASAQPEIAPLEDRGYALEDVVLGSDDAPVTVVEYYSPTCPHCGSFHENAFPQLKSEYIDTGKVRFIAREVYFDQVGLLAGRIARCGGSEPYYKLFDVILGSLDEWGRDSNPAQALLDTVVKAGFPTARLQTCLDDREYAIHLVDRAKMHGDADEIESTPTFIIGDQTVRGAVPFEEIAAVIEEALP